MADDAREPDPARVPLQAREGVRWIATAAGAIVITTIGATFRGPAGPRAVPLAIIGLVLAVTGVAWDLRRPRGPAGELTIVVAAGALLLSAEAWLQPDRADLSSFLAITGLCFLVLGVLRNDRRPVVVGIFQWAVAAGHPLPGGDTFRHCLVATDLEFALPRILPVVAIGAAAIAAAMVVRRTGRVLEAGRGLETSGLTLVLGGLAAKALELPGHRLFCGTGDAIDAGWAALLLAVAAAIGALGVLWGDQLWAASGLAAATLFGLAAITLEANPWWGLAVGLPLVALLIGLEVAGVRWPRRDEVVPDAWHGHPGHPNRGGSAAEVPTQDDPS